MPDELHIDHEIAVQSARCGVDAVIADLARRQHGRVARWQLLRLGIERGAIENRLLGGRLHLVHRGVYAVGHRAPASDGHWMAAVLACGPGALLSHRSAGALAGIRPTAGTRIEVIAPRHRRGHAGIDVRQGVVASDEATSLRGVPVTTVERTMLDLSAVLNREQLRRALQEAEMLRLVDFMSLERLLERHRRRRGSAALRALVADGALGASVTRSELEDRFLEFLERARLPEPEVNVPVEIAGRTVEVDCLWRAQGLVAELDGHASHAPGPDSRRIAHAIDF